MNAYIEVIFITSKQEEKDRLVALLSMQGFEGFEEERNSLKAFIPEPDFDEAALLQLNSQQGLAFTLSRIENRNWNAEWESGFQPVVINGFCAVRAGFHPPVAGVTHDIIITPKMSFGTGHHATTWMMVAAMAGLSFKNKQVFDYGTGTGVLAVLAEKLGAAAITAIDNDANSIENAAENLAANGCTRCTLYASDSLIGTGVYDIILGNINRNVILQNIGHIKQHLSGSGVFLASGLLTDDQSMILEEAKKHNMRLLNRLEKDGWICLELG
jgi:ribosomal protein L11 methyltransferase